MENKRFLVSFTAIIVWTSLAMSGCALFISGPRITTPYKTYEGKVVDADTLEPIEGARIEARWRALGATVGGEHSKGPEKIKTACTDKNGNWEIWGPRGWDFYDSKILHILSFITATYFISRPSIDIDKSSDYYPIYCFLAYPYLNDDSEGMILIRRGGTTTEKNDYYNNYDKKDLAPFIPLGNAEKKLRTLSVSFQYPKDQKLKTVRLEGMKTESQRSFMQYSVVGLKRKPDPNELFDQYEREKTILIEVKGVNKIETPK